MKEKIVKHLNKLTVTKNNKILLAVSGGVDSMVLMNLLYQHGYKIMIAHCNFCLRGKESDQDQLFVKETAVQNNIKFYSKKFDTRGYSIQNKISSTFLRIIGFGFACFGFYSLILFL